MCRALLTCQLILSIVGCQDRAKDFRRRCLKELRRHENVRKSDLVRWLLRYWTRSRFNLKKLVESVPNESRARKKKAASHVNRDLDEDRPRLIELCYGNIRNVDTRNYRSVTLLEAC